MGTGSSPPKAEGETSLPNGAKSARWSAKTVLAVCCASWHLSRAVPGSNIPQEKKAVGGQEGPSSESLGKDQVTTLTKARQNKAPPCPAGSWTPFSVVAWFYKMIWGQHTLSSGESFITFWQLVVTVRILSAFCRQERAREACDRKDPSFNFSLCSLIPSKSFLLN